MSFLNDNQTKTLIENIVKAASALLAASIVAYAGYSVFDMFYAYVKTGAAQAILAALASVGVAVALLALAVTDHRHAVRGMCAVLLVAWALLVLVLVSFASIARFDVFALPSALTEIGRAVAALLPALALIPVIAIPLAMRQTASNYPSATAAAAHYVAFAVKGLAIASSAFAAGYFGANRGMPVEVAILCAVLLEGSTIWAYLHLTHARQRGDVFDVAMWTLALLVFGAFIAAVSVETISTLAGVSVPVLAGVQQAGEVLFVSATGLTVALTVLTHVLTRAVDIQRGDPSNVIRRTAGRVRALRGDLADLRAALTGDDERAALGEAVLTREVVLNGHSDDGAGAPRPKRRGR